MNPKHLIYSLSDPRTDRIRYVGRSSTGLERPKRHWLNEQILNDGLHVHNWCKQLISEGIEPCAEVLEYWFGDPKKQDPNLWLNERERYWIKHFRECGADLTNLTDGGEGCSNPPAETREKMRFAKLGHPRKPHSEESKRKMAVAAQGNTKGRANKGKVKSEEVKKKISIATSTAITKWWAERKAQGIQ